MSNTDEFWKDITGSTARKEARKSAREQQNLLTKQNQKEQLKIAEAEDEIKRRRLLASKGGMRSSLLAGPETGMSNKLGGGT